MMNNINRYRKLCQHNNTIPLFCKDWWLDAVAENKWNVALCGEEDQIKGALVYCYDQNRIYLPKLTQHLGLWLNYPTDLKSSNRLAFEKEVVEQLIQQLPKFDNFVLNFNYNYKNWLPFYWNGFSQTTYYTYVLQDLTDLDELFNNFRSSARREIRKAQKKVTVTTTDDIELFYSVNQLTFSRQQIDIKYSLDYLKKIDESCVKMDARKIFLAKDDEGKIHSAIYIIWDENSAYYIMGGNDPKLRSSGATSLLMWEAIQFASQVTKKFDFEGSMIEPIEKFFRSFGPEQQSYFNITKTNSKKILIKQGLKQVKNALFQHSK